MMRRPPAIVWVPAATALVVGCLAQPHPFGGSGTDGGSRDGTASGSSRCDSPTTIDPFVGLPLGSATCVRGSTSATYTASGGTLTEMGSNSDAPYCEWTLASFGTGVVVELEGVTSTGGAGSTAYFSATPTGTSQLSLGVGVPANSGQLDLTANGVAITSVPNTPLYLLLRAPDDRTVDLAYNTSFDPDLTSWILLQSYPVGAGVTRKQTKFQLRLAVGVVAGAGSARFAQFQQCP